MGAACRRALPVRVVARAGEFVLEDRASLPAPRLQRLGCLQGTGRHPCISLSEGGHTERMEESHRDIATLELRN